MDKLVEEMKSLAARFHARRLCLFGSRARGDHRADSDYDFALWGIPSAQQPLFLDAVDELPDLIKIDVVFVQDGTDAGLLDSIRKDGLVLMDKLETKYENYKSALARLQEGIALYAQAPGRLARDGIIQRFEFTCELAWKTAREYLLEQGHTDLNSPKAVMRQAFADGLVSDGDGWASLLTDRNLTSHLYDEATADQIFDRIKDTYLALLEELLANLK